MVKPFLLNQRDMNSRFTFSLFLLSPLFLTHQPTHSHLPCAPFSLLYTPGQQHLVKNCVVPTGLGSVVLCMPTGPSTAAWWEPARMCGGHRFPWILLLPLFPPLVSYPHISNFLCFFLFLIHLPTYLFYTLIFNDIHLLNLYPAFLYNGDQLAAYTIFLCTLYLNNIS